MTSSREKFFRLITSNLSSNSAQLSSAKYAELVERVSRAKESTKGEANGRRLLTKYDLVDLGDAKKLIDVRSGRENVRFFVHEEELYDILYVAHKKINHKGRDKMKQELEKHYANISLRQIMAFLSVCEVCAAKPRLSIPGSGLNFRPMITKKVNERASIDFLDLSVISDQGYSHVLIYRDSLTCFVLLRPLKELSVRFVVEELVDILSIFGAPLFLQYESDVKFLERILHELSLRWNNNLKILIGKSKEKALIKRSTQDIKNMICHWMRENSSHNWIRSLNFIQLQKNRLYNPIIYKSPYESMYGHKIRLGLQTSGIPNDLHMQINSEEDLETLLSFDQSQDLNNSLNNNNNNNNDEDDLIRAKEPLDVEVINYKKTALSTFSSENEMFCDEDKNDDNNNKIIGLFNDDSIVVVQPEDPDPEKFDISKVPLSSKRKPTFGIMDPNKKVKF